MSLALASEEDKILNCIDQGIDVFGKSVKDVVYWRLHTIQKLDRKDIPRKPDLFSESLRSFFGERSLTIEQSIVTVLIETLHVKDVNRSDSMAHVIAEARRQLRSQS
jgi:hypothetical protein